LSTLMRNTHWYKLTYQDAGLEQAVEKAAAGWRSA
jgi:hypothetical protein